jgi:hypothetical protein
MELTAYIADQKNIKNLNCIPKLSKDELFQNEITEFHKFSTIWGLFIDFVPFIPYSYFIELNFSLLQDLNL